MRDFVVAFMVAGLVLFGGYVSLELLAGRSLYSQESPRLPNEKLIAIIENPKAEENDQLDALLKLGSATEDLDIIVPLLANHSVHYKTVYRQSASMALTQLGADAVAHLQPYFDSEFQENAYGQVTNIREVRSDRAAGCSAIKAIGDDAKVFLPKIKSLLEHENESIRSCGLFALQGMPEGAEELLDLVIARLDDQNFNNRCSACRIIEMLGPKAAKAESKLQDVLKNDLPSVRGWAALCLGAIGKSPSGSDNASLMAENLKKSAPAELARVLVGISKLGPDAKHVAEDVRPLLKNWDKDVQVKAAFALYRIAGEKELACKTIGGLLASPGYEQDGLDMAAMMGPDASSLLPKIVAQASAGEDETRERVAVAIGKIGPAAISALSTLNGLRNDTDPVVREVARNAILKVQAK